MRVWGIEAHGQKEDNRAENSRGMFTKIYHILGQKTSLNKFEKTMEPST